ncbi:hypothetical protein V496_04440 [Pseudogymnoascus sp. VKM F-4515 (FW-2607)]|nr:hypothetical protein V496_04440 [Pseudogymnoascus sp. VKM F-4515 (FW-2607)]
MAPPRRSKRDTRKVQTRLTFAPNANANANTNSPSQTPSGISPTPARILYQDPRHPKKKQQQLLQPSSSASAAKNEAPSSSARSIPYFSDDEDIFADGKKFAVVLPSPSRAAAGGTTSFMGAKSSVVRQRGRPKRRAVEETDSSESEEEVREVTPREKKKTPILVDDDDEEAGEDDVPAPAETIAKPAPVSIDSSASSDEDEIATPADKRRKRPTFLKDRSESSLQSPTRAVVRNGAVETPQKAREESGSPSPRKAKRNTPIRNFIAGGYLDRVRSPRAQHDPVKNGKLASRKEKGKEKVKEVVDISSDEDGDSDDIVVEQPSIRKKKTDSGGKGKALPSRKRRRSTSSEEDDEPIRSSPTKRRKQVLPDDTFDEESDSSPAAPSRTPPQPKTSKSKSKKESTRQTRQTNTPKKHRTEKQKTLELLKRRRAGEKIDELTESSSDYQEERGAYDSDASHAALSVFDDEESEEGALEKVRQSLRPGNRNMDDDSFIVSDDDTPLGAPSSLHSIPLEFTHQAHKHLKSHFKDCIEWMVQKKINPSFNQHDAIYIQAFRKLEPEARGLAHSKFSSSAWKEAFVRALWARPEFCEEELGAGFGEGEGRKCDACGRSGHPARFRVRLEGKPYFQATQEDVEDSAADDDDDDDDASVNSKGQPLPPADTEFYLGRFCRANAEKAHALIHWKHALYSWVVQTLSDQGFLEGEKLAERVRWGERKLGALACEIVDEWVESGEVKGLWRDFKNNLEVARSSKQDRWNA